MAYQHFAFHILPRCNLRLLAKETGLTLFSEMPWGDVASWNTVIGGLMHNEQIRDIMRCFPQMQTENVSPDKLIIRLCKS